jgi:hemoglobin
MAETTMSKSLYERLGGTQGIENIANDLVELHVSNPVIGKRFLTTDKAAAKFFISGTGGPNVYTGKDMIAVHKGMNISSEEFLAVLEDGMKALTKNGVGEAEKQEVLSVLFSMRADVMHQ